MKGTPAIYKGRIVDKNNFCAFVYGSNGEKKLIKSWNQYEASMQSGIWFPSLKDALASQAPVNDVEPALEEAPKAVKAKAKTKSKPGAKSSNNKIKEPPQKAQKIVEDDTVFEVTGEDGA